MSLANINLANTSLADMPLANSSSVESTMPVMPDRDSPTHVRLIDVTKTLGSLRAVDNVSLNIPKGSMVTLLGPSGCGKSTTLRLLAGFYQPTSGEIYLGDERITNLPPNRRRMTMMFQEYALFPHLKVGENVAYGLRMRKTSADVTKAKVVEMLDLIGLSSSIDKYPHQLSGGQQQRVALARALAVDPEVLLLDEPLSNLDAKLRVRLREEIVRLQKVLGKTMVFVTHDQEEALSISDRIAVMKEGRIAQIGSPTDIYFHPNSRYVAEFVGLANFVEADVVEPGRARIGEAVFDIPGARDPGKATLVVRPEAIRFASPQTAQSAAISGRILRRSFLGNMARYLVDTPLGEWTVDEPTPDSQMRPDEVRLAFISDRVHVLSI
jgi:ABC-type Fe3+/spermidine/putrescine transport system ATPase subunit